MFLLKKLKIVHQVQNSCLLDLVFIANFLYIVVGLMPCYLAHILYLMVMLSKDMLLVANV